MAPGGPAEAPLSLPLPPGGPPGAADGTAGPGSDLLSSSTTVWPKLRPVGFSTRVGNLLESRPFGGQAGVLTAHRPIHSVVRACSLFWKDIWTCGSGGKSPRSSGQGPSRLSARHEAPTPAISLCPSYPRVPALPPLPSPPPNPFHPPPSPCVESLGPPPKCFSRLAEAY